MGTSLTRTSWQCLGLLLGLLLPLAAVQAQDQNSTALRGLAQDWVQSALTRDAALTAAGLRMEANVGALDSRLKLAPCAQVQVYLPLGSRLWGRTRVGVRCLEGAVRWNVTMPTTVNAYGLAWVVKNPVPAGAVLDPGDLVQVEVNWAEDTAGVLAEKSQWLGQVAVRALSTGQTLRVGAVKPAQVFQAGAQVRVTAQGSGFQMSADAQAMSAGVVGESARVRLENGHIATGTVLDARTVQIDL